MLKLTLEKHDGSTQAFELPILSHTARDLINEMQRKLPAALEAKVPLKMWVQDHNGIRTEFEIDPSEVREFRYEADDTIHDR